MLKLEKWLCRTAMMFALAFIIGQVSFANNESTAGGQNLTSSSEGQAGIVRSRIPVKVRKGLRELDKTANIHTPGGPVQLFASFVSDTPANQTVGDVTVVPVVGDESAYLYVAFRVTSSMKVDIEWYIDDSSTAAHTETAFGDMEGPGGNLSNQYWYFAWFKPDSVTPNGLHSVNIKVRKHGNEGWLKDSCRFLVLHYLDD